MDAAASRRTMSITTGLGSVAGAATVAGRPSPSCRRFRPLTRTTACWLVPRHCGGVLSSTALGKRQRLRSETLIACPILPPPPLVERPGPLPTGGLLSAPDPRPDGAVAGARPSGGSQSFALVLADSGSATLWRKELYRFGVFSVQGVHPQVTLPLIAQRRRFQVTD